jgi:hypothetical protein
MQKNIKLKIFIILFLIFLSILYLEIIMYLKSIQDLVAADRLNEIEAILNTESESKVKPETNWLLETLSRNWKVIGIVGGILIISGLIYFYKTGQVSDITPILIVEPVNTNTNTNIDAEEPLNISNNADVNAILEDIRSESPNSGWEQLQPISEEDGVKLVSDINSVLEGLSSPNLDLERLASSVDPEEVKLRNFLLEESKRISENNIGVTVSELFEDRIPDSDWYADAFSEEFNSNDFRLLERELELRDEILACLKLIGVTPENTPYLNAMSSEEMENLLGDALEQIRNDETLNKK